MTRNPPTQPLRDEHAGLLPHINALAATARELPVLDPTARAAAVDSARAFLEGHLVPHALAEEAVLYPAWAELLAQPDAAATMIREHEAIVSRITRLAEASPDDVPTVQEILFGLHALITTHFGSEEVLVLDVLDAHPDAAAAVLEAMADHT